MDLYLYKKYPNLYFNIKLFTNLHIQLYIFDPNF